MVGVWEGEDVGEEAEEGEEEAGVDFLWKRSVSLVGMYLGQNGGSTREKVLISSMWSVMIWGCGRSCSGVNLGML